MNVMAKAVFVVIILTGVIMDSMSSYAAGGRGDFNTVYKGQSVDDLIIQYMAENKVPGMVLAIVQAPYITRVVGYGFSDLEKRRLAATRTVFNIGQLTNAFTAVAIMQLKEAGKLDLDQPIHVYLPDVPKSWASITVRHLLTHTSGISDYSSVKEFDYSKNERAEDLLKSVIDLPLLFKPGTEMQTSNTDAYLLGLIIEKVSGMSYQEFVTRNQIERVGLKHTFFIANTNAIPNEVNNGSMPFKHREFLHNPVYIDPAEVAQGYELANGALTPVASIGWSTSFASSGILATAEDISLWDIALAGDILVKDPADRAFLYNPVIMDNRSIASNAGWFFPGHKGLMEIKGNVPGYSSFLSRFTAPDELLCVTLLANKGNLPDLDVLARKIAASFDIKLAAPDGAVWSETIQSPYSVKETIARAMAIIEKNGGTVFSHIDHAAGARKAGQNLEDTEVIIIGNPAKGTALMQKNAAMALDLPLRIMATRDSSGQVWLSYTDPVKLAQAYHLDAAQVPEINQIAGALRRVCQRAVSPQSMM